MPYVMVYILWRWGDGLVFYGRVWGVLCLWIFWGWSWDGFCGRDRCREDRRGSWLRIRGILLAGTIWDVEGSFRRFMYYPSSFIIITDRLVDDRSIANHICSSVSLLLIACCKSIVWILQKTIIYSILSIDQKTHSALIYHIILMYIP